MPTDENNTVVERDANTEGSIDWTTVDVSSIPFDVIRNHPKYEEQRQEAIKNRLKLDEFKAKVETPVTEPTTPETTPEQPQGDPVIAQLVEELKALKETVTSVTSETAAEKRKAYLTKKLQGTNIPQDKYDKAMSLIDVKGADFETLDQRFDAYVEAGNWKVQNDTVDPANPDNDTRTTNSIMSRVDELVGLNDVPSIFNPSQQSKVGGQAVLRK